MPSIRNQMPVMTTYRLRLGTGEERTLTMPRGWRITYGPNVPGMSRRGPLGGFGDRVNQGGWCFRVYDRNKVLKLAVPDVQEFWEEGTFTMEVIERDPETNLVTGRVNMERPGRRRPINQMRWSEAIPAARSARPAVGEDYFMPPPDEAPDYAEQSQTSLRFHMDEMDRVTEARREQMSAGNAGITSNPIGGGNEH